MRDQSTSKEDSAAPVMAVQRSSAPWRVLSVTAHDKYVLHVRFADGLEGRIEMSPLIFSSSAGVFAALKDETIFRAVVVEQGAVAWPNGLDLAPDAMHRAIARTGCFRPGTDQAA
jgi:hypothetical protein